MAAYGSGYYGLGVYNIGNVVISGNAAISVGGKAQYWHHALGLLALMRKAHLLPNVITYSAAISACEKAQQWHQALGPPGG